MSNKDVTHYRWADVKEEKLSSSIKRRFIHSDNLMLAQMWFGEGAVVPAHRHENEQITYVIDGKMEFKIGDKQDKIVIVKEGEVIVIPSNVLHSARILEDCFELDIFNPPREDWLDGSDAYLRQD